jgi:hypothetical protein
VEPKTIRPWPSQFATIKAYGLLVEPPSVNPDVLMEPEPVATTSLPDCVMFTMKEASALRPAAIADSAAKTRWDITLLTIMLLPP